MNILKYIFSFLLVLWGLLSVYGRLITEGLHFPFLTVITFAAIIMGIFKNKNSKIIFLVSACLWITLSAETIGFVLFFDSINYDRMIVGIIPLLFSIGLMFSVQMESNFINNLIIKTLLVSLLVMIGIGSYIYKPRTEEINCWYYFDNEESYNVLFVEAPEESFEVELTSAILKQEVKREGMQYERINGYYCPETKVRIVTRFGKIISAKIISFRNTEKDKKVTFTSPTKIPLEKVNGKLDILKPYTIRAWN